MNHDDGTKRDPVPANHSDLAIENARLRELLARAGLDADPLAAGNVPAAERGRTVLPADGAANDGLRQSDADLKASRAALAASEDRYNALLESAADYAIITMDLDGRITGWNPGATNVLGWDETDALGRLAHLIFTPEDREAGVPEREMRSALENGRSADERWHMKRDGSRFWASGQLMPLRGGPVLGYMKILRDRTGQHLAEARLRESEERLRLIVESPSDYAILTLDDGGCVTSWNSGAAAILGWTEQEILGQDCVVFYTPEDVAAGAVAEELRLGLAEGRVERELWLLRKNGERFWASQTLTRMLDGGQQHGLLKILRDRTEAWVAEDRLRESEARFRHMADSAPALVWMTDAKGRLAFANLHYEYMFGRPAGDILAKGWGSLVVPEDAERLSAFVAAFPARKPVRTELRVRDRHGDVRWLRCDGVPRLDDSGSFLGFTGCNIDITEARLAAEDLEQRVMARTTELSDALARLQAEEQERKQVEEKLHQAQKIEALGQLTGGIAHDFNNMLQAIGGSLELMERRLREGRTEDVGRFTVAARETVQRAATLTHRLLAFARRQTLAPTLIDPGVLVKGIAEMIQRTAGAAIEVRLSLGDALWPVRSDANQLENVLLNLSINARDAMPDGGILTVSATNVPFGEADLGERDGAAPGDYVEFAATDTGTGMAPDVLARAFEPFFTTKPAGQGTGLGLSQIYGFARQSDGFVRLESAPGRGTALRFYLPRCSGAGTYGSTDTEPSADHALPRRASGTVLLVEDEAQIRALAAEVLREQGHQVFEAADGAEALRILHGASGSQVDLLVTDVGLPGGMNGRQLGEAAHAAWPRLKLLFMTGYAGSILDGQITPQAEIIKKPFALDTLSSKVRTMVEGDETGKR